MSTIQFHPRFFCTLYFLFESASAFTNIRRMNNYCFVWPWKYLLTTHGNQQKHLRNKNNFCFGFCGEVCFCVLYIFFQSWMSPQNVAGWMVPLFHCQSRLVFVIISQKDMIDANMMPVIRHIICSKGNPYFLSIYCPLTHFNHQIILICYQYFLLGACTFLDYARP